MVILPDSATSVYHVSRTYTTDYSTSGQAARKRGGALWVSDLTTPNSTKALPLAAVVLLVANMQLAFAGSR